jgi:hypothetical protein
MSNTRLQQSIFPDYPREREIADKNGMISNSYYLFLSALTQALQLNFKNTGIQLPLLNSTQIAEIQAIYTPLIGAPLPLGIPDISGQTIFDSTNRVPKVFIITYDGATPPNILTAQWRTYTVT